MVAAEVGAKEAVTAWEAAMAVAPMAVVTEQMAAAMAR